MMLYRLGLTLFQHEHQEAGSTSGTGDDYEKINISGEQVNSKSDSLTKSHKGDYELTQCVAYGPVN